MKTLDRITIDPGICLGQPTIRGMRITVSIILKQIAGGMSVKEILAAYPELQEEDIEQALSMLKLVAMGKKQIDEGKTKSAAEFFKTIEEKLGV